MEFYGNAQAVQTLRSLLASGRILQTILLAGPEGVGKATLARRFGSWLLPEAERLEQDDLSLPSNAALIAEREKWPADKRNDDPLLFSSHPDFVTFPPDGPLRQLTIQQMRLLKERAQYGPLKGPRRIILIDQIDRANEQAANSLLKILEEPPAYLIILMTAANPYDLLPTIRSRSVVLPFQLLDEPEMQAFAAARGLTDRERRLALANGSPGRAVGLDLATYDRRRAAMLALLQTASRVADFASWAQVAEKLSAARSEKLESYLEVLYLLLEDVLLLMHGSQSIRNPDLRTPLAQLAGQVSFVWLRAAVARTDELAHLVRRNIQKSTALDAFAVALP